MLTAHVQEVLILLLFCNPSCNTRMEKCQKRRCSPRRNVFEKKKKSATKKNTTRIMKNRKRKIRQMKNKSRRKTTTSQHVRRSKGLKPAQKDVYLLRSLERARPALRRPYRVRPLPILEHAQSFVGGRKKVKCARSVSKRVKHSKTRTLAQYRVNFLMANASDRVILSRTLVVAHLAVIGKRQRASNLE